MSIDLFKSRAGEDVKQSVIRSQFDADAERRQTASNRIEMYKDSYIGIIEKELKKIYASENYKKIKNHINVSQNVLKRVINEISTIYKVESLRFAGVGETEDKRYKEIKEEFNFDVFLRKVQRYVNLLRTVIVKIGWIDERLTYDMITPNVSWVWQNEDDITKFDALLYMVNTSDTPGKVETNYIWWDYEGWVIHVDHNFSEKDVIYSPDDYPYRDSEKKPFMPFVTFRAEVPDTTFWEGDTGTDLYNAGLHVGVGMTQLSYFKKFMFKQPYLIGDHEFAVGDRQVSDAETIFTGTGEGAAIGSIDRSVQLDLIEAEVKFQIQTIINNYGISADQYTLSVSELSGRALKIRNQGLLEIRKEQLPFFRQGEKELFEATRIVNNAEAKGGIKKIKDNAEFRVDFGEMEFEENPLEQLEYDKELLKSGLISPGKFYQLYNPDIKDEADAEKAWMTNFQKQVTLVEENETLADKINKAWGEFNMFDNQGDDDEDDDDPDDEGKDK